MASRNRALHTNLLGRTVKKGGTWIPGDMQWSANDPDMNNEHYGVIAAVWLDDQGSLKATLETPRGHLFTTYLTLHQLIIK